MKVTCFLFLMISCAGLTPGTASADPSGPASQQTSPQSAAKTFSDHPHDADHAAPADGGKRQKEGNPSDEQRDRRHPSDENRQRGRASLTVANHLKQVPNNRKRSIPGNAMKLRQLGSDKSEGAAKGGIIQRVTVHSALPVRPASVIRPTVPLRNNVRHRGANPAVIGGSANSDGRNTGAINGTGVHRRP